MRLRERNAIVRKPEAKQNALFSYKSIEDRIPKKHPIRTLKKLVDQALDYLDDDFEKLYSNVGRPVISPSLLRACPH